MAFETIEIDMTKELQLDLIKTMILDFDPASQSVFEQGLQHGLELNQLLHDTVLNEAVVRALEEKLKQ